MALINRLRKMKVGESIEMCAMSNFRQEETGLSMIIWSIAKTGKEKHGPRIKVQQSYGDKITKNWFTVTVSDSPEIIGDTGEIKAKDLKKIIKFVKINKKPLLDHWEMEITSRELSDSFIKNKKKLETK